eukprot:gb/GECG01011831.1/.p1 GENE.gb/GECG01011831.1/~~gb/GECG01011831.1/.p1  ORF type:complete len:772 (+),score=88.68 gb/GECG01011831.1/:1-2316(+)
MGCNVSTQATQPDAPVALDPHKQVVRAKHSGQAADSDGRKVGDNSSVSYHVHNCSTGTSTSFPEPVIYTSDDQQSGTQTTETVGQQTARAEEVNTNVSGGANNGKEKTKKDKAKERKRLRRLGYKHGFSHDERPYAWKLLLEADKLYEALPSLYKNLLLCGPSLDDDIIRKDVGRTFPTLPEFTSTAQAPLTGHYLPCLYRILTAYANLDSTVGYCQGMSFVAGLILLAGLEEVDAFYVFLSLMLRRHFAGLYQPNLFLVQLCNGVVDSALSRCSKKLSRKLSENNVSAQMYATSWLMTGFARSTLPISTILAVIDVFVCETMPSEKKFTIPKFLEEASTRLEESFSSGNTELFLTTNWEYSPEAIAEYRKMTDAESHNHSVRPPYTLLRCTLVLVMQRKRRLMRCGGMESLYPMLVDGTLSVLQTSVLYTLYVSSRGDTKDEHEQEETKEQNTARLEDSAEHPPDRLSVQDDTESSDSSTESPVGELEAPVNGGTIARKGELPMRPRTAPAPGPSRRHSELPSPHSRGNQNAPSWRRLTLQHASAEHDDESARTAHSMITSMGLQYSDSEDEEEEDQDENKDDTDHSPPSPTRRFRSGTMLFSVKPFSMRKLLRQRTRRKTAIEFKRNSHLWRDAPGNAGKDENVENPRDLTMNTSCEEPKPSVKLPLFPLEPCSAMPSGASWRENENQRYVSREKVTAYVTSTMGNEKTNDSQDEPGSLPEYFDALCDGIPCESWMLPERFLQILSSNRYTIKKGDVSTALKKLKNNGV